MYIIIYFDNDKEIVSFRYTISTGIIEQFFKHLVNLIYYNEVCQRTTYKECVLFAGERPSETNKIQSYTTIGDKIINTDVMFN